MSYALFINKAMSEIEALGIANSPPLNDRSINDPKMEVRKRTMFVWPYSVGIFPYIGLTYRPYI